MDFREALKTLPVIYADKEHMEKDDDGNIKVWPKFPCWCKCTWMTWSLVSRDYIETNGLLFFDGENFHYTKDLYFYDGADWITKVDEIAPICNI